MTLTDYCSLQCLTEKHKAQFDREAECSPQCLTEKHKAQFDRDAECSLQCLTEKHKAQFDRDAECSLQCLTEKHKAQFDRDAECVPTAGDPTPHSWLLQGTRPRKILWHFKKEEEKKVTRWVHPLKRALWFTFANGALSPVNRIG